jgi:hypothetical protein
LRYLEPNSQGFFEELSIGDEMIRWQYGNGGISPSPPYMYGGQSDTRGRVPSGRLLKDLNVPALKDLARQFAVNSIYHQVYPFFIR